MGPYFFANWKMNKVLAEARDFCERFSAAFSPLEHKDVGIAPPITALSTVVEALLRTKGVMLGVQNVHWAQSGAHTAEVSVSMIRDLSAEFAILGHSERRQFYGETSENVSLRTRAVLDAKLTAIVCVGESKEQYEAGQTEAVCREQLTTSLQGISDPSQLIIAYEPVWAIGTGLAATPEIASGVHKTLRADLKAIFGPEVKIPILYGGSTSPDNIAELLATGEIDGALVGGASLDPDKFLQLIERGREAS